MNRREFFKGVAIGGAATLLPIGTAASVIEPDGTQTWFELLKHSEDGKWFHFVRTVQDGVVQLYVDGVAVDIDRKCPVKFCDDENQFAVIIDPDVMTEQGTQEIGHVAQWGEAISEDTVKRLYNAT